MALYAIDTSQTVPSSEREAVVQHPTWWFDDGNVIVFTEDGNVGVRVHRERLTAVSPVFQAVLDVVLQVPAHERPCAFGQPCIGVDCTIHDVVDLVTLAYNPGNLFVTWPALVGDTSLPTMTRHFLYMMRVWEVDRAYFRADLLDALHRDWPASLAGWDRNLDCVASGLPHGWPDALPMLQLALQNRALLRPLLPALCYRLACTTSIPDIILLRTEVRNIVWIGHVRLILLARDILEEFKTMAARSLCCRIESDAQRALGSCGADILCGLRELGERVETSPTFCTGCKREAGRRVTDKRHWVWGHLNSIFGI
ncbi:hypothetical protein AURDEDRAFT_157899 [Auricularia subglabra TFB-10046 SS5]|nr:hypothetical protein AURDEDRAFT_157899 [Auricularia subglabra TFB-10046 SS5]